MQIIIQEQDNYAVNAINQLEGAKTTQYILRMELGRFVQNAIANRMKYKKSINDKGGKMNQRKAKELRKETRKYWKQNFSEIVKLKFWERIKVAWKIVRGK